MSKREYFDAMTQRDTSGRFMSPRNEVLEEFIQKYGLRDFAYVEAQHVRVGMLALNNGAKPDTNGWERVVRVQPIYKGVCLHYEGGGATQRDNEGVVLIDCSDLPTAFLVAKHAIPHQSLGNDSLKKMRGKLDGP